MSRLLLAAAALLVVTACASTGAQDDDVSLVPPANPNFAQPVVPDQRIVELQTAMTELLERLDVMADRINRLEAANAAAAERVAGVVVPEPRVTSTPLVDTPAPTATTQPAQPPRAQQSAVVGAQIAESYRSALMLIGRGKAADARRAFQQVFDADPNGELADNALFWIGETYFTAGDFGNAMRYYQRVTTEFSDQNKAPDALYKIGLAHVRTGDLALARAAFEECMRRYPYSTPAASAKAELARIKY